MNLNEIITKPYILALFKRDDGERFLLGSGAYEFKDSQQHFTADVMSNDVVEVQGSDGALLAGQVRRAQTQSFDGFICDGTSTKSLVENYRKNFIAYFQKNHLYTVIYVFSDGTAIQRKRGYIVDAPQVKELYQLTPEYHIALNFEDVNYYKYAENSIGEEIYSNFVDVSSSITATGGLIWANSDEPTLTGGGTNFTIYNTDAQEQLTSVQIKGSTSQVEYSGKNLFDVNDEVVVVSNSSYEVANDTIKVEQIQATSHNALIAIRIPNSSNLLGKTINISFNAQSYAGATGGRVILWDNRTTTAYLTLNNPDAQGNMSGSITMPNSFPSTSTYFALYFYTNKANQGGSVGGYTVFSNIQIEIGSAKSSYEPYVGGVASPNPDYPQTVNNATGTQTITISDGNNQSQTFNVRLGSLELCRIGNYQDYIYKDGNDWYVHKATDKVVFTGAETETWSSETAATGYVRFNISSGATHANSDGYCNELINRGNQGHGAYEYVWVQPNVNAFHIQLLNTRANDLSSFRTWLGANPATIYYTLTTATDTQITDADLISDLNALLSADTYNGKTKFVVSSTNELAVLRVQTIGSAIGGIVWDEIGAIWEEGEEGGDVFITVDSIIDVLPVITIVGPAHNPQISNITTGQTIRYSGNVVANQRLVIDISQKTAKLSGTSVVQNISGDWLKLKPGTNRISYTIDNNIINTAIIEWQEITG